jgi:ATP-binding cassette subfamily B protein/subfamily B ATP-binding cassette protein MsbA
MGEFVGVVGPSGSGKSTLLGLVPRLFDPWEGRVLVGGLDVVGLDVGWLRSQVAVVLQEPFLFPVSVAENIGFGRPGVSRAEVEAAAEAAGVLGFVGRLPGGLDSVVGERGATLSGGERQRVAIARALVRDAPVVLLDEPTSALDAGVEGEVLDALAVLVRGRTTLVASHRESVLERVDRVVDITEFSLAHRPVPARAGSPIDLRSPVLAHVGDRSSGDRDGASSTRIDWSRPSSIGDDDPAEAGPVDARNQPRSDRRRS